jgi:hypothetical protein
LRMWLGLFILFIGEEHFDTGYVIIAWLCWVPNLMFAELLLVRRSRMANTQLPV